MGVAAIYNVPEDPASLLEWSFNHMAHHRDINRRIWELYNVRIDEYSLDPMNPKDLGVWGYQHQLMHNDQNAVLGISGNDLLDVNWQDQGEREVWILLNASEHYRASNILGV